MTKSIISIVSFLIATQAFAFSERVILDQHDLRQAMQRGKVIHLKQALKAKYPRLNLNRYKLNDIHMNVIASDRGRLDPEVELLINSKSEDRERIFVYNHRERDRVWLTNHFGDLCGSWQVVLKGAVRATTMEVTLHELSSWDHDKKRNCHPDFADRDDRRRPPRRPPIRPRPPRRPDKRVKYQMINLGTEKIEKFAEERVRFNLTGQNTYEVRISTTSSDIDVIEAYAVTVRGDIIDLYELRGRLHEDTSAVAYLRGERIDRVEFVANSVSLFGSRARMTVEAGVR